MTAMVLSSLLLVLSGAALWPYSITERNYFYLPYYDRFTPDYLNGRAPFYYPAAEADRAFAVSVSVCGLLLAVSGLAPAAGLSAYVRQLPVFLAPAWMAHRYFCLHRLNRYTPRRLLRTMRPFSRYEPWKAVAVWLAAVLAPLLVALMLIYAYRYASSGLSDTRSRVLYIVFALLAAYTHWYALAAADEPG